MNEVSVGAETVRLVAEVAVPPGVITAIRPVVAPVGTTAVMLVAETTLNVTAATPLKVTDEAPVKLVPVIVTVAPRAAVAAVKLVTVGAL